MKDKNDKFKLRYIFYTLFGWTLFCLIFIILFFILTPFSLLLYLTKIDKKRKFFTYTGKLACFSFFSLFFLFGHRVTIKRNNLKKPRKGEKRIYLINHSSIYDVILSYLLPGTSKFIIKDKWVKKPFIGWMQGLAGNIIVGEEKNSLQELTENEPTSIHKTLEAFRSNLSIIVFPEGTRSMNGQIQRFKRGAFRIALEGKADIVPVVIDDWNCVRPSGFWIRDIHPHIQILPSITYAEYSHLTHIELAKLVRYQMIKSLYQLREERKEKQKNYYRNFGHFVEEDLNVKAELEKLAADLDNKGIHLEKKHCQI